MILVTGVAGFIGMHVALRLLADGEAVIGIDNLNNYYDTGLKQARLKELESYRQFTFAKTDIADRNEMLRLFARFDITRVVHLAAQAGVRYSLENPHAYGESNLTGFLTVIELCRQFQVEHLVYASSSSVYGDCLTPPYSEKDSVDYPVSLYAATKKANELMAHSYSHLYSLPTTGLRFFTVYGPWGRPDMAYFIFTRAILEGKNINLFNEGKMRRDFTYIDDIVEGVTRIACGPPPGAGGREGVAANYRIYNIGNNQPVELMTFVRTLEECLGKQAIIEYKPMQPGDVLETCANIDRLGNDYDFSPSTDLKTGLTRFIDWYRDYYPAG